MFSRQKNGFYPERMSIVYTSYKCPGVDFTKGFKTWHKFTTEIRFMLIPIIVLFIAQGFINRTVLTQQVNTEL